MSNETLKELLIREIQTGTKLLKQGTYYNLEKKAKQKLIEKINGYRNILKGLE